MSWPKIKEGYAALGHLYGLSSLKMNRFAYMASAAGDKLAAQAAFAMIGNDWDHQIWIYKSLGNEPLVAMKLTN
jgi:hypothetical protein